jgi:hypothetical protein
MFNDPTLEKRLEVAKPKEKIWKTVEDRGYMVNSAILDSKVKLVYGVNNNNHTLAHDERTMDLLRDNYHVAQIALGVYAVAPSKDIMYEHIKEHRIMTLE